MKKINSICIIDDDPITVFGIKKILSKIATWDEMHTFANGKMAIDGIKELLESEKLPEIIFLDINMPIMDGWQFLEEFIQLPITKKIQINIITSSIDPADKCKAEHYTANTHHNITFKNKPLKLSEIQTVTKVLEA